MTDADGTTFSRPHPDPVVLASKEQADRFLKANPAYDSEVMEAFVPETDSEACCLLSEQYGAETAKEIVGV